MCFSLLWNEATWMSPSAATKQNIMMLKHPHCICVCLCVSCKNSTWYNRSLIYYPFHPVMCSWIILLFVFRILDYLPSDAFSAHKGWTDTLWVIKFPLRNVVLILAPHSRRHTLAGNLRFNIVWPHTSDEMTRSWFNTVFTHISVWETASVWTRGNCFQLCGGHILVWLR